MTEEELTIEMYWGLLVFEIFSWLVGVLNTAGAMKDYGLCSCSISRRQVWMLVAWCLPHIGQAGVLYISSTLDKRQLASSL